MRGRFSYNNLEVNGGIAMNDQERLQEINELFVRGVYEGSNNAGLDESDISWLIGQANILQQNKGVIEAIVGEEVLHQNGEYETEMQRLGERVQELEGKLTVTEGAWEETHLQNQRYKQELENLKERIETAINDLECDRPKTAYHVLHSTLFNNFGERKDQEGESE